MANRLDVVVFTYNHEAFIERALRSILSQNTTFELNIRINDDASTDKTVDVINHVLSDSTVSWQLTQSLKNRYTEEGITWFHEFLAESCDAAEFIALLDGDDFWIDDNKLQHQVDLLDRFPSAALCHHSTLEISGDGEPTPIEWPPAEYRREIIPGSQLSTENVISTSSVVVRSSMFPKEMPNGYNVLRIGDYPMWSLAAAGNDIAFIDKPMSAYRVHSSNLWNSLGSDERFDRVLEAKIYISNNVPDEVRPQWRSGIVAAVKNHLDFDLKAGRLEYVEWQLATQAQALAAAEEQLAAAQEQTERVLGSASWRLTRPLRAIMATRRGSASE